MKDKGGVFGFSRIALNNDNFFLWSFKFVVLREGKGSCRRWVKETMIIIGGSEIIHNTNLVFEREASTLPI